MHNSTIVRSEVKETKFGLYTDTELRKISVCKIVSPLARDSLGNALTGGLYDPRMGATQQGQQCPTCGSHHIGCPGHPGHIELDFPVYHPLLFSSLFQLMRSACFCCHRLRMGQSRLDAFLAKLQLLEMGDVHGAETLDDRLLPATPGFPGAEDEDTSKKSKAAMSAYKERVQKQAADVVEDIDKRYRAFARAQKNSGNAASSSSHAKKLQRVVINQLSRELAKVQRCERCSERSPGLRKDGSSKIFAKPLAKKFKQRSGKNVATFGSRTALEEVQHQQARRLRRQQRIANGEDASDGSDDDVEMPDETLAGNSDNDDDDDEQASDSSDDDDDDDDDDDELEGPARKKAAAARAKAKKGAKGSKVAVVVPGQEADKYLVPLEVEAAMQLLWTYNADVLDFIWGRASRGDKACVKGDIEGWRVFFLRAILVAPNRFRPEAHIGDSVSDHPQNAHLGKIIETNESIRQMAREHGGRAAEEAEENAAASSSSSSGLRGLIANGGSGKAPSAQVVIPRSSSGRVEESFLSRSIQLWIQLQTSVNCYMDSAKDPNPLGGSGTPAGIRQLLEKKEGIFRMNMMGKRVNYCCRSVISPDPYIGVNEIGIPVKFAKTLHYPTPVNEFNAKHLRMLVERGPHQYPGANQIETYDGKIIKLDKLTLQERVAKAKLLLATPGNKVYRHLVNGDSLLVNRQPSLHKPSIMAHKARVLTHVPEQTLRMHYSNCSSYNADFDGDEMNCHFVQNELARAEANLIMNTDNQYIVPTSGNPLRGLIQDHVASGVKLTCKETFLNKDQFMQLVYIATSGLEGTEVVGYDKDILIPIPAILKPQPLWTGKQVISALLDNLIRPPLPPINLDSKTRTPASAFGADQMEDKVIFRCNHLLRGVLDKNAVGASTLGIVHAVYELYGASMAGTLLHSFGCLFTYYLQDAGHTCGLEDLVLTAAAEEERSQLLKRVHMDASVGFKAFVQGENVTDAVSAAAEGAGSNPNYGVSVKDMAVAERAAADLFAKSPATAKIKLDGAMQSIVNKSASNVIKACTPNGLYAPFLKNNFSMMVMTGAKGSSVNQSSISCMLGQQALEGQRPPLMVSGKSLPSFRAHDGNPRAHGFVADRFLTGIKPQEYYFHAMAGREGLVDTAVKTSRSGYLQRCLVKHLEELKVNYDNTVRDSGGNIIQFLYGDDGVDPMSSALLAGSQEHMAFLARNYLALTHKYGISDQVICKGGLQYDSARAHNTSMYYAKKYMESVAADKDNAKLSKKSVVHARRKMMPDLPWSRKNMKSTWESAAVLKVHTNDDKVPTSVDLRYLKDDSVEKKVPLSLLEEVRSLGTSHVDAMDEENSSVRTITSAIPLIRSGLPDPSMSHMSLASSLGACSERVQRAIDSYVQDNPDRLLVDDSVSPGDTAPADGDGTALINADGLEMIIWMKYLQSLACPGEAVGCVAAQSVGEPSTQMTLNTFHLAGHGGANVTLGIPRLREIVMTASRVLKTPTMTIPLLPHLKAKDCRSLARQVSCLQLSQVLSHKGGISIGEEVTREGSRWVRQYRVRLHFESFVKIKGAFGVSHQQLIDCVSNAYKNALLKLIQTEQRKAGESASSSASMSRTAKDFMAATPASEKGGAGARRGRADSGDDGPSSAAQRGDDLSSSDDEIDSDDDKDNGDDTDRDSSSTSDEEEEEEDAAPAAPAASARTSSSSGSEWSDSGDSGDDSDAPKKGSSSKAPLKSKVSAAAAKKTKTAAPAAAAKSKGVTFVSTKQKTSRSKAEGSDVSVNMEEGWLQFTLTLPARVRRLLMIQLAEQAANNVKVRSIKGINQAFQTTMELTGGAEVQALQTEGVNFEAVWALSPTIVNLNEMKSNDIYAVLLSYGVEAARECISNEIKGVFAVYGINVNPRHLSLIADFMTRNGSYVPMNRQGMGESSSPYVQMSFETTCQFLTRAALEGLTDNLESPTARIVLGQPMRHGTGCFDVMVPVTK